MKHRLKTIAGTRFRRPIILAAAAAVLAFHFVPGAAPVQWIEVISPSGQVEQDFTLCVSDPRVATIRTGIQAAQNPERYRGNRYASVRWQMELATFYSADRRYEDPGYNDVAVFAPRKMVDPTAISQVSFEPTATRAVIEPCATIDWNAYWTQRRITSEQRLREIEAQSSVAPIFQRLRVGRQSVPSMPVLSVLLVCMAGCAAFLVSQRFLCCRAAARIGLRPAHRIEVPRAWIRYRGWRMPRMRETSLGGWSEAAAIGAIGCSIFVA